jgi:hypothetical protein
MTKIEPRTLDTFRAAHDRDVIVPNKIRAALEQIRKAGPEHYEYEGDFVRLAGISQNDIGLFREQFKEHIVETRSTSASKNPKRCYFGDPKVAARARK